MFYLLMLISIKIHYSVTRGGVLAQPIHADQSDLTMNLCLGDYFEGIPPHPSCTRLFMLNPTLYWIYVKHMLSI